MHTNLKSNMKQNPKIQYNTYHTTFIYINSNSNKNYNNNKKETKTNITKPYITI